MVAASSALIVVIIKDNLANFEALKVLQIIRLMLS